MRLDWVFNAVLAQSESGHAAAEPAKKGLDFVGHVANGEHALFHIPPIFGIDFSVTKHVLMLLLVAIGVFLIVTGAVRSYLRSGRQVPSGTRVNALEVIVEFVRDTIARPNLGDKWLHTWTPLLLTFFVFILGANAIGLIPIFEIIGLVDHFVLHSGPNSFVQHLIHGGSTATGNFNVTAALASITFVAIITAGTLAHGFIKHWVNLVPHGLPKALYLLLIPLEIVGMFVRPFALTMRLAANMTGGHIAILAILSFVFTFAGMFGAGAGIGVGVGFSVPLAAAIQGLEIIVVIVQAYVFTLLSAVFIGMAIHAHH
jgi:F-type H+-transporting ATPase subunit a